MATIYSNPTTVTVTSGGTPSPDALADWLARSTASGVTLAENWSAYTTAEQAWYGKATYGTNTRPDNNPTGFAKKFQLITTPGHVLSGKALRIVHGGDPYPDTSSNALSYGTWGLMFNGDKANVAGAYMTKAYVQVCLWVDEYVDYHWKLADGSLGGSKFFIIDHRYTANIGEFVITNQYNRGFVTAYRRMVGGANQGIMQTRATQQYSSNVQWQPAVDNGTPLSDENSYQRRYGPFSYGMTGGTSQASKLSTQGVPDPEAAMGGVAWNRGGITVVEVEVDLANDRGRWWAAPHGVAPKLLGDTGTGGASFGSRVDGQAPNGTGWSVLSLTNLIYTANGTQNPGYPLSSIDYAEIIVSSKPINFPGGFALPGA